MILSSSARSACLPCWPFVVLRMPPASSIFLRAARRAWNASTTVLIGCPGAVSSDFSPTFLLPLFFADLGLQTRDDRLCKIYIIFPGFVLQFILDVPCCIAVSVSNTHARNINSVQTVVKKNPARREPSGVTAIPLLFSGEDQKLVCGSASLEPIRTIKNQIEAIILIWDPIRRKFLCTGIQ